MNYETIPNWAILAIVGGILTFIGLFAGSIEISNYMFNSNFVCSGYDMLSSDSYTWAKFLPLVAAILGLLFVIFTMIVVAMGGMSNGGKIFLTFLALVTLVIVIIYFVAVSTGAVIDWDQLTSEWVGTPVDIMKDTTSAHVPFEGYLLIAGPIISFVGSLMSFNDY